MYEEEVVNNTKLDNYYKTLLSFYPAKYRKRFGEQMLYAFQDLYQEELTKSGKIETGFWLSIFSDTAQSATQEHLNLMQKEGFKNYFHIGVYNILGGILLLPFIFLFGVDFLGRLVQGDFTHYNRAWYGVLSQTFFYGEFPGQIPFMWTILVSMPILAVILNLIPYLKALKNKRLTLKNILLISPLAVLIMGAGLFCLLVVLGHDVVPCTFHGILNGHGILETMNYCKNA